MIGKLSGIIDSVSGSCVILDVGGVGYLVTCSGRTLRNIGKDKSPLSLLIETHVREEAINLFGFIDLEEQQWFRLLTTVQGVGAKVALAILGSLAPAELAHTIAAQDKSALTKADGVGPKLALRLVTELKDKALNLASSSPALKAGLPAMGIGLPPSLNSDAISALVNLGYRRADAFSAVANASQKLGKEVQLDELIRAGLFELSSGKNAA